jgi:hypothetical protein
MTKIQSDRAQDILFIAAVILLPFQMVPQPVAMQIHFPVLSFPHASAYPVAIGLSLLIMRMVKEKQWAADLRVLKYFAALGTLVLLSALWGIVTFPYVKMPDISTAEVVRRTLKYGIASFLITNGTALWVYCLFRHRFYHGLLLLRKGLLYSFLLAGAYSIIEICYLFGFYPARHILVVINHWIHTAIVHNGWWPPLLWQGQVRSVCPEPSFFGAYATAVIPFLACYLFDDKCHKLRIVPVVCWLFFLLLMTKSRTALIVLFGETALFSAMLLWLKRNMLKRLGVFLLIIFVAYILSDKILMHPGTKSPRSWITAQSVTDTLGSVVKPNARSNASRFAVQRAEWTLFLHHPLLGVGPGLSSSYIEQTLLRHLKNEEMLIWVKSQRSHSAYRFPIVNSYSNKLAELGLVGTGVFLAPLFGIVVFAVRRIWRHTGEPQEHLLLIAFFVAFIGSCVGLFSVSELTMLSFDVLLGFGFCILEQQLSGIKPPETGV